MPPLQPAGGLHGAPVHGGGHQARDAAVQVVAVRPWLPTGSGCRQRRRFGRSSSRNERLCHSLLVGGDGSSPLIPKLRRRGRFAATDGVGVSWFEQIVLAAREAAHRSGHTAARVEAATVMVPRQPRGFKFNGRPGRRNHGQGGVVAVNTAAVLRESVRLLLLPHRRAVVVVVRVVCRVLIHTVGPLEAAITAAGRGGRRPLTAALAVR